MDTNQDPNCQSAMVLTKRNACIVRNRDDCSYNAVGDMRRTESLKQKLRVPEQEGEDLKTITTALAFPSNQLNLDWIVQMARGAVADKFCSSSTVAAALRLGNER